MRGVSKAAVWSLTARLKTTYPLLLKGTPCQTLTPKQTDEYRHQVQEIVSHLNTNLAKSKRD